MTIIPNWHPIFVHFTLVLLIVSGIVQLSLWTKLSQNATTTLLQIQKWLIIFASLSVLITVATGGYAFNTVNHDGPSHLAMLSHRLWAVTTAGTFLLGALFYFFLPRFGSKLSAVFFVAAMLLVSVTGFKGAELVYRHGLGVMSLPNANGEAHQHEVTDDHQASTPKNPNAHDESAHHHTDHQDTDQKDTEHRAPLPSAIKDHHQEFVEELQQHSTDAANTVDTFKQALHTGNAPLIRELLEDHVLIYEGNSAETSADQYANHHMKSDIEFLSHMEITQLSHNIEQSGDMALYTGISQIKGRFHDKEVDITSTETIVLKQSNHQWKITHIHWSN